MTTFNKILNPVYSAIANYSMQDDGSISAKYVIGTGEEKDGAVINFAIIMTEYKYIDSVEAKAISETPLTKDDIGKTPSEIMLDRIHKHLKEKGHIIL